MARLLSLVFISFLITATTPANIRKKRNLELLIEPIMWIERLREEAELRPLLPSSGGLLHGSSGGHSHQSSSETEATTEQPSNHSEHHSHSNEHQSNGTEHQSNGSDHQSHSGHGGKDMNMHQMMHHHHHHHEGGDH